MTVKGQTVQTGERPQTKGRTDATKRIITPATRSIITFQNNLLRLPKNNKTASYILRILKRDVYLLIIDCIIILLLYIQFLDIVVVYGITIFQIS